MLVNEADLKVVGENIQAGVIDGKIVFVVDPTVDLGVTKSGKNQTIAKSGMFPPLFDGDTFYNMWVGRRIW